MGREIVLFLAITTAANAAPLASYVNPRYGYAIQYPALLKPVAQADTGDGRVFSSTVGHASFRVSAVRLRNPLPAEIADEAQQICPGAHPSYRVAKAGLVAMSCKAADHIVYQKSLLRNRLMVTIRGAYPARDGRPGIRSSHPSLAR